ncbi:wnt inhibitory factor 1-like [Stylophora pistillata]|uniref:wnt inhibitory factor 1-like n=1 Tax=Stylophora pistillata TaxID=50429 RepID=UPI000C039337|nr:wnt inhibitory factor 1-like [Stylophora pistillata]
MRERTRFRPVTSFTFLALFLAVGLADGLRDDLPQTYEAEVDNLAALERNQRSFRYDVYGPGRRSSHQNDDSNLCIPMCANSGTCVNRTCICSVGWRGRSCREEVCSPGCLNGGTCENGKCKCPSGWEGDRCQNIACTKDCANGAACVNDTCVCINGWAGETCTKDYCLD